MRPFLSVSLLIVFAAPTFVVAQTMPAFVPLPREAKLTPTTTPVSSVDIRSGSEEADKFAAQELRETLASEGIQPAAGGLKIQLLSTTDKASQKALADAHLDWSPAMDDQGYVLISTPKGIDILAASSAGLFYGAATAAQLLDTHLLTTGTIRDWPAMKYRAIQDDLSRGPVPTVEFQKQQIRTFAHFKINIYSPYFEHTLVYTENPLAAPPGGSVSREDAKELVAYATQYHVMIVPDQEAFGHLHHVLKYESYADLAELPHGAVVAPGEPRSFPVIKSWFTQIAADFPSPFLHIGADETSELGLGRTRAEVEKRGLGPVYGEYLAKVHDTLAPLHRRVLFWGDIATASPDSVASIPKDMIAVPWIYWHKDSYDGDILPFKNAGIETWVAPGDANWNTIYPEASTAFDNISGFVAAGQRLGSTGMLNTVWDDDGEGLFNSDWYSVMFGAAASWQQGTSPWQPYQQAFPAIFYGDRTGKLAEAHREVMQAQRLIGTDDELYWADPWSAVGQKLAEKVRPNLHEGRLHAEKAIVLILDVRAQQATLRNPNAIDALELAARRIDFVGMKFQLADEMASDYSKAGAMLGNAKKSQEMSTLIETIYGNNGRCYDLRDAYSAQKDMYRKLWLSENRPYYLGNIMARYDLRIQLWEQRAQQLHEAIGDPESMKSWPTPQSLGILSAR